MKIEVIGGPFDGRYLDLPTGDREISLPVRDDFEMYRFGSDVSESFLPTFKIATMPIRTTTPTTGVAYWSERSED